jgi:hypothetical protein
MKHQANQAGNKKVPGNISANGNYNRDKKATESLLEKFFTDQLQDIYYAEQQLLKALPKMQQAATTEELEDSFADLSTQTEYD